MNKKVDIFIEKVFHVKNAVKRMKIVRFTDWRQPA
jgi:hypothetical protein